MMNILSPKLTQWLEEQATGQEGDESFTLTYKFAKSSDEQVVSGIVYAPMEVDSDGEFMRADTLRKAAAAFLQKQVISLEHSGVRVSCRCLESFIAPSAYQLGNEHVTKGSWVLSLKILDSVIWQKIKSGVITGLSLSGLCRKRTATI